MENTEIIAAQKPSEVIELLKENIIGEIVDEGEVEWKLINSEWDCFPSSGVNWEGKEDPPASLKFSILFENDPCSPDEDCPRCCHGIRCGRKVQVTVYFIADLAGINENSIPKKLIYRIKEA